MATQIANDMKELKAIMAETKKLMDTLKEIRDRKKQLESNILQYLEENSQPGVKYQELIVLRNEKTTFSKKKPKEREQEIVKILEENGVADARGVYKAIGEAGKGEEIAVTKLKVKQTIPDLF